MQSRVRASRAAERPPMAAHLDHRRPDLAGQGGNQAALHRLSKPPSTFRPTLKIGAASDPLEHEADRVADRVMRMTEPQPSLSATEVRLSRTCAHGEEEDRTRALQMKPARGAAARAFAPPIVHEVLATPGRPLDEGTRGFFEPRLGCSLADIRLHDNAKAADSAREIGADAYAVGNHVAFAAEKFTPSSHREAHLLAHELVHVLQYSAGASSATLRRDLAIQPPEITPQAQPDLTDAEIREAINYNNQSYDPANIRLIQSILGGPVSGQWRPDNIRAIAATQERYRLKKDGKVGPETFKFITGEQALEGAGTETANCLTAFRVIRFPVIENATAGPGGITRIVGHHTVQAHFSARCNCSEFQYRQFIGGAATASRGGVVQDLASLFSLIPGGALPIVTSEDGNTACPSPNYGHREQPGQAGTTTACGEDHYVTDDGTTGQATGCIYRGEDFPKLRVSGLASGDTVDLLIQFRGEIQRNGRTVESMQWTDIDTTVTTP